MEFYYIPFTCMARIILPMRKSAECCVRCEQDGKKQMRKHKELRIQRSEEMTKCEMKA
jgi:hypothetical protein